MNDEKEIAEMYWKRYVSDEKKKTQTEFAFKSLEKQYALNYTPVSHQLFILFPSQTRQTQQ
jgi:hypothetical protein